MDLLDTAPQDLIGGKRPEWLSGVRVFLFVARDLEDT